MAKLSMAQRRAQPKAAVKKKSAGKAPAAKSAAPSAPTKQQPDKQLQKAIAKGRSPLYKDISDQMIKGY